MQEKNLSLLSPLLSLKPQISSSSSSVISVVVEDKDGAGRAMSSELYEGENKQWLIRTNLVLFALFASCAQLADGFSVVKVFFTQTTSGRKHSKMLNPNEKLWFKMGSHTNSSRRKKVA